MKNKYTLCLLMILSTFILASCQKEINQEQAIQIAQSFVNTQVKLFSEETTENGSNITNIEQASMNIIEVINNNNEWNVIIHIESNATGELKKRGLNVVVDAKTGEIDRAKPN